MTNPLPEYPPNRPWITGPWVADDTIHGVATEWDFPLRQNRSRTIIAHGSGGPNADLIALAPEMAEAILNSHAQLRLLNCPDIGLGCACGSLVVIAEKLEAIG